MMRRWIAALLALLLAFGAISALGESENSIATGDIGASEDDHAYEPLSELDHALLGRPVSDEPTHVTVGSPTRVSGYFTTDLWGNNTSDMDVRALIHGYDLVVWHSQVEFITDPMVVQSLDTAKDHGKTVYTVKLQNDLTYSDGATPITAKDYVFSLLLCASPAMAELGGNSTRLSYIDGYDAYHSGSKPVLSGVRMIDEYTFSITVEADYEPYFYDLASIRCLPYPISVIAPGCVVADNGKGACLMPQDETLTEPPFSAQTLRKTMMDERTGYCSHPVLTSGPYKLTSYDARTGRVELAINPYFKGNYEGVKPLIDTLTLLPVKTEEMISRLESGEIDLLNKCVSRSVNDAGMQLASSDMFEMASYARIGYGYCALACEKGPQQFQAVRQALAYAIDADTLIADYLGGYGMRVNGYYGIGQWMTLAAMGAIRPEKVSGRDEAAWEAITLDGLEPYNVDTSRAVQLLENDGWTLNKRGESFDPTQDTVRCKLVDDVLMPLSFVYAQTEGHEGSRLVGNQLREVAPVLGMEVIIKELPFAALLEEYYRTEGERGFDICVMATNFVANFDPYYSFAVEDSVSGRGITGIKDTKLEKLAWDMHRTEPKNYLAYEQKWLAFQQRYNELLPTLPLYSNVYFDFYTSKLQKYVPSLYSSWTQAILYAYVAQPQEEAAEDMDAVESTDEVIFID